MLIKTFTGHCHYVDALTCSGTLWMLSRLERDFLRGSVSDVRRMGNFYRRPAVWMTQPVSLSLCQELSRGGKEASDLCFDP